MASETIIAGFARTKSRDFGDLISPNLHWRHVSTGEHQIQFWHESAGYISIVKINGVVSEWTGDCLKVNIVPNETIKLGVVEVPFAVFEKN